MVVGACNSEEADWKKAQESDTVGSLKEFVAEYPESEYVGAVHSRIHELEWQIARDENSLVSYQHFVDRYPESEHLAEAVQLIEEIAWGAASDSNTVSAYEDFLTQYPQSNLIREARYRLRTLLTITDLAPMVVFKTYEAQGKLDFTGSTQGTQSTTRFSGQYEAKGTKLLPRNGGGGLNLGLVPGVMHSFEGRVYLPAPGKNFRINGSLNGEMRTIVDNRNNGFLQWVFSGKIGTKGHFVLDIDRTPNFRFDVPKGNSLVFLLTTKGYEYVSGTGLVKTPDGDSLVFRELDISFLDTNADNRQAPM